MFHDVVCARPRSSTGLPHFGYLLESPGLSIAMGRDRVVPVMVPHAGRCCVHKLALDYASIAFHSDAHARNGSEATRR